MSVLQLTKRLTTRPQVVACSGLAVRHYQGEADIEPWLALRRAAFARQRLGIRDWSRSDFEAEFLTRWWWRPERMWLAEPAPQSRLGLNSRDDVPPAPLITGSVTLGCRGEAANHVPVVHWLAVHPSWRRRGVASSLVARLEAAVWEMGQRQVWLETHDAWIGAAGLYRKLGYQPASASASQE